VRPLFPLLLLTVAGLSAGGCATAGLALMGPLAGSLTAIADRSVDRTMPAELSTTWGATADALARMAVRIEQTEKSDAKWRLTGTGEKVTVHSTLERVTAGMTKVSVRVEGGGLFADKQTSEELLNQVAASLARFASARERPAPGPDAASEELRQLHREIERLGTKIEQAREVTPPSTRPGNSPVTSVGTTPILTIPTSVGVATVPATDVSLSARPAPPSAAAPAVVGPDAQPRPPRPPAERLATGADSIVAEPMRSVEVLRPVEALQIRPVRE
jgi:Protein of unknown function (DUF3568)